MPRLATPDGFRCAHLCRECGGRCILEPHPINVMHKCEQDHAEPFDPTAPADAFNSGLMDAEASIYAMLREDYPDMDDGERRRLAHEGALKSARGAASRTGERQGNGHLLRVSASAEGARGRRWPLQGVGLRLRGVRSARGQAGGGSIKFEEDGQWE